MRRIFYWLFRLYGWKLGPIVTDGHRKAVVVAAPHTSNWDLVFCLGGLEAAKLPARFTIKKEWLKFPLRGIMRSAGAVGIDRSPKVPGEKRRSMVEAMAQVLHDNDEIYMCVTPEGTRKRRTEWHTGFYHTALLAGVPILLGYVDYAKKEAGIAKIIHPSTETYETDMREIMAFYAPIKPRFPQKFSLDQRFLPLDSPQDEA